MPILLLLVLNFFTTATHATPHPVTIERVIDGDTVRLDDGNLLRIIAIDAPERHPDSSLPAEPFAEEARDALVQLTQNNNCHITHSPHRHTDRHGRILAHLFCGDQWIAAAMVGQGLAKVYSFADTQHKIPELLALEHRARQQKLALWSHPANRVLTSEDTHHRVGQFVIVQGCIHEATRVKSVIYLNFSDDWRHDFTIQLLPPAVRQLTQQGKKVPQLASQCVRVRGFLIWRNGPMIRLDHLEPLEWLPS